MHPIKQRARAYPLELEYFWGKMIYWPIDPCDPKWPQIDICPHKVTEGLKLIYMYKSYGHAM